MKRLSFIMIYLAATFFADAQNIGIGTLTPQAKLHIFNGTSGITPFATARLVVETNDHSYINLLSPDPFETGILFGSGNNAASGVISYNSSGISKGFLFSTNGNQQRMVINSAGNVGIGTTAPQKNLSVQNGMNVDQADGNTGSTINAITFGNGSGEGMGSRRNAGVNQWGLDFYTNAANRMSITNSGNVGIGTASPAAKLQVSSGDASLALFGPNTTYGAMLYIGSTLTNQSNASTAQVFVSDGNLHIDPAQGHNIYIGYYQSRDIYLNPTAGNVGIGTTSPQQNLSVKNGMNIDQADANTGSAVNAITFGNNSGEGIGSKRNAGGNQWGLDFYTSAANRMSITNVGKVGIGTTAPAATLEVNGYTKLGSDAPAVKIKKFTGTTDANDGGHIFFSTGIDPTKIISITTMVFDGIDWIEPLLNGLGKNYYWEMDLGGGFFIYNWSGDDSHILSKPYKVVIMYEE